MIIRILVVDPDPKNPIDDVIVYQVPEKSRQEQLLTKLLDDAGLDWTRVRSPRKKRTKK